MTLDNASETPPEPMQQPVAAEAWKAAAGQVSAGPFRCLSEMAENRTFLQGATRKTHLPTEGRQTFQQRGGGTTPQGAPRKGCRGLDVPSLRTHSGHSLIWAVPVTSEPGLVTSAVHKVWPDGVPHEPPRSEFPAQPQPWPPDPGGTSSLHCSTWHGHGRAPDWTVPSHRRQKRPRRERLRAKRLSLTEGKLTSRWPGS